MGLDTSRIKIVILKNNNPFALSNAGANRFRSMAEGLEKRGIDILMLITQGFSVKGEYSKFKTQGSVSGISYRYLLPLPNSSIFFRRLSFYVLDKAIRLLNKWISVRIIRKTNPDIMWLGSELDVFELFLSLKTLELPEFMLFLEINEIEDAGIIHSTNRLQEKRSMRFRNLLLSEILPVTDLLAVMTKMLFEHYRTFTRKSGAKIMHLPMTVDLNRFRTNRTLSDNKYIAYCGSTSFLKDGVDILLKSFSELIKLYPWVRLKIAAPMDIDNKKMISLIEELELDNKVDYLGLVERDYIPAFLESAILLALPRPDSKQAVGGFPTKLGEYLATGRPVCVTKVGEITDYLKDGESAFMAIPGDTASFLNAMIQVLSDPDRAEKVGINGRIVAERNFSMELQASRLYSFLTENKS
jgi:glycosyltransferase involved in cell wall biosynthesis